ncbi:MAG: FAD-binding protein [Clostridia bacterium]|nr:FAD-binding protein [Clostridia bacterium]
MTVHTFDAVVIGTGAAGYSAACRLKEAGVDVAIVTEGKNCGTSRNTGSDKQTYYKLSLGGETPDSPRKMARDLFEGGSMDGDNALCEAALSTRCFFALCEMGVPFPHNRYGEFVGYQTDHDTTGRATSAGPLTSKFMTEALEARAEALCIPLFNSHIAVEILKSKGAACGVLCLHRGEPVAFRCRDVILATGGPAGIWADSVYPACHRGSSSLALRAGAVMQNLGLWQFGLASTSPRWNVSGTYMQVLPRFVSVDRDGTEHDFLSEAFADPYEGLLMTFLKGYQWPFDPKKATHGSSRIDLLVHRERVERGRRVYLDFTRNPFDIDFSRLPEEAREYLARGNALGGTPIERLERLNAPAIELYRSKGVSLETEYLEIALCAQHNNGGVAVDAFWQSTVPHLFAVGECAGTHGIARPGGSALNAGQVGALRAAQFITCHPGTLIEEERFAALCEAVPPVRLGTEPEAVKKVQRAMSATALALPKPEGMAAALEEIAPLWKDCEDAVLRDIALTASAVLTALLAPPPTKETVQELRQSGDGFSTRLRPVRPIPDEKDFFEVIWKGYRENKNVF